MNNSNQDLKGNELVSYRLGLLKEKTAQGKILLMDTSAIICSQRFNEREGERKGDVRLTDANYIDGLFYLALAFALRQKEIDFYLTNNALFELGRGVNLGKLKREEIGKQDNKTPELEEYACSLDFRGKSLEDFIETSREMKRVFNSEEPYNPFYSRVITHQDRRLLREIRDVLDTNQEVAMRIVSPKNARFLLAYLYTLSNQPRRQVLMVNHDQGISRVANWFLNNYQEELEPASISSSYRRMAINLREIASLGQGFENEQYTLRLPKQKFTFHLTPYSPQIPQLQAN